MVPGNETVPEREFGIANDSMAQIGLFVLARVRNCGIRTCCVDHDGRFMLAAREESA
jgi:hypothetical protein